VENLDRSVDFFTHLGFVFNPDFTDEKGTCMVLGEDNFIMLLTREFFSTFVAKSLANPHEVVSSLITLSAESREEVDLMVKKALEKGAKAPVPSQDHGWMYQHGFEDLDGHIWEFAYMDAAAIPPQG